VWRHYSIPIPSTATGVGNFLGVGLYCWQPGGTTGTFTYDVRNVVVKAKVVPIPPPTLEALEKVKATGLWLGTYAGGGGTRNSVYTPITTGRGVSWVGVATPANPVTYSMTIAQYPDSAQYPGIQSHIFLSSDIANGAGAPEWNSTNAIFFQVVNNANGSGFATFMIKTNAPGTDGRPGWGDPPQIFGTGNLATLGSASVTGTWSITFTSDTDVTVTAPDNTFTNFSLPAEYPPYFQYVFASFGIQQNNNAYGGQHVIFSHVGISAPYNINDSFTAPVPDASFSLAGPQYGAQIVPPGSAWYAKWLLPASGFDLELSPDLANWTQPASTNSWEFDVYGWFPLAQTDLPGATQNFFRMVKPDTGQLQVLLPGESNAPNTPTGKTGTPAPQTLYNTFDLTINRCDATWHIVPSSDTVAITSSDTLAALPPDTALVNGTATISGTFSFNSSGTWTITATDVTTNTVAAGTSSPITIP
jgi:hypothetical protein